MVSKKLGCPLSSIFQQWTAQHQRQQVDIESHHSTPSLSYRILLQTSYSLKDRITAAEPVENPHLYKRAGLATPPERAIRDIHGASETAWLLRLVELATQQQQRQKQNGLNSDASLADTGSIIFLTTKSRSQDYSIVQELPQHVRRKVQVVDIGYRDPFGWEEKEKSTDDETAKNFSKMDNLQQLYRRLQGEFDRIGTSGTPVILIWQSLTPLIVVHGFKKALRLLCALPTCLQVWPVNLQVMTPKQHAQLEDASNAILHLNGGEMNIIRQGIRERGNVLRQKLPFRLEAIVSNRHKQHRFRIADEAEDEERGNDDDDDDHRMSKAANSSDKEGYNSNATVVDTTRDIESSHFDGRSRGVHLHLEENDGGRNEKAGGNLSSEKELTAPYRPRIFLQDDDPEFDDFDEEDPDDDLDI